MNKRWSYLFIFVLFLTLLLSQEAFAAAPIGYNLDFLSDSSSQIIFVDAMKQSRDWLDQNWAGATGLQRRADGYPTQIPQGSITLVRSLIFSGGENQKALVYPAGQYNVFYDGSGTIQFEGDARVISSSPGRITLDIQPRDGVYFAITSSNVNDPIRNIRIIMPGYESTYTTQPFYPPFINRLSGTSVIRFMNVMNTNRATCCDSATEALITWNDRTLPESNTQNKMAGMAVENLVAIANAARKSPWFTISHLASDDYVRNFARYVNTNLDPNLDIYVEFSNEVWNNIFLQNRYAEQQGCLDPQTRIDDGAGSCDAWRSGRKWQGKRSGQIYNIFQEELTDDSRLVRVIASQIGYAGWPRTMFDPIRQGLATVGQQADAIAVNGYFGGGVTGTFRTYDDIVSTTVDQVLDRAETDLNGEVLLGIQAEAQYAAQNGLRLLVYEGGHHLAVAGREISITGQQLYDLVCGRGQVIYGAPSCTCGGACSINTGATYTISGENLPDFVALMSSATHHSRMRQLYNRMFDLWFQNGGDIFNVYKYVSFPSKWGLWGTLDHLGQLDTQAPMYQGVIDGVTRYFNFVPGGSPPPPTAVCGNNIMEGTEQCDDGNVVNGDGCSSTCQSESPPPPPPSVNAMITVNPSQTYQTMRGWEVTSSTEASGSLSTGIPNQPVLDQILRTNADLGLNRIHLEFRAGVENPTDWTRQLYAGTIPYRNTCGNGVCEFGDNTCSPATTDCQGGQTPANTWRQHRYEVINDNADPFTINPAGFHFTELNQVVNTIVLPYRNLMAQRGKSVYINLNYVAFTGDTIHSQNPEEYAEMILAVFRNLSNTFGLVPDGVEIILEPDVAGWNGGAVPSNRVGPIINAAEQRLNANGFFPDIIAPSNTNMWNAYNEFQDLVTNYPSAAQRIDEVSFHRYNQAPVQDMVTFSNLVHNFDPTLDIAMIEHLDPTNTYDMMHNAIQQANVAAWQIGVIGGAATAPDGHSTTRVDLNTGTVTITDYAQFMQHYINYTDISSVRVGATSTDNAGYSPLAFINPDGLYTVVVKTTGSGNIGVSGLPAGTYGIRYTTGLLSDPTRQVDLYNQALPDVSLIAGNSLQANMPGPGVITIFQTSSSGQQQVCGNNIVEGTEQCDDGNMANNDGCSSVCMNEATTNGTIIGTSGPASKRLLAPPTYAGTCPIFVSGQNTLQSSGSNRNFLIRMPTGVSNSDNVSVVFAWHGVSPADMWYFQSLITPLVPTNVLVVTMEFGPSGTWTYGTDPATNNDLRAFDDIIACLHNQFNTNPNNFNVDLERIYSTGHSLGGLFNTYLTMHRADRLGASVSFSGGTYAANPYTTPNAYIPALFSWGGPNDIGGGFAFNQPNLDASTSFAADGNFVVQCQHSEFHSIPSDAENHLWPFFRDHWIGQTTEPYENGLPYTDPNYPFTSYCLALPYTPATPPTITIGDVSGPQLGTTNGVIDNQDVLLMVDHIIGTMMLNLNAQTAADTTCDQRIDIQDILLIFRDIRGLGDLPVSCP